MRGLGHKLARILCGPLRGIDVCAEAGTAMRAANLEVVTTERPAKAAHDERPREPEHVQFRRSLRGKWPFAKADTAMQAMQAMILAGVTTE